MSRRIIQQGSAVIAALFIMALVAIATTAMTYRLQIDVKRLQWITLGQQLQNALEIPYYWARGSLISVIENADEEDSIGPLKLPLTMPQQVQHNVTIDGKLQDAQRLFNINNLLANESSQQTREFQARNLNYFSQLLRVVLPELDEAQAFDATIKISEIIVTPATNVMLMEKQALPPNQFVSVSELRAFPGFSKDQFNRLAPYLIALPEQTPININNASKSVLRAYFPGVEADKIDALFNLRKENGQFESFDDFKSKAISLKIPEKFLNPADFTLQSKYFLVEANASSEGLQRNAVSLVKRQKNGGSAIVEVVWRTY